MGFGFQIMIRPVYGMEPISRTELDSRRVPVAVGVCVMGKSNWTPRIVPYGADQTAYFVVDCFASGSVYREAEVERTDLETVISDLLTGQFNDPVRVIAFNTLEHWSDDMSDQVAAEIRIRCDMERAAVPEHLRDFVDRHTSTTRQLSLRLA
jgi:hypothetical protein